MPRQGPTSSPSPHPQIRSARNAPPPSTSSPTNSELLNDLGVTKSHSRPRVSNDNPFIEAHFKTSVHALLPRTVHRPTSPGTIPTKAWINRPLHPIILKPRQSPIDRFPSAAELGIWCIRHCRPRQRVQTSRWVGAWLPGLTSLRTHATSRRAGPAGGADAAAGTTADPTIAPVKLRLHDVANQPYATLSLALFACPRRPRYVPAELTVSGGTS